MQPIRILFLADSHLGLDLPERPRVERRRRGHDFLANHAAALEPALAGEADLVVHGGDVFDHPRASPGLARLAYEPLLRVADRGVPVIIVPGNHERARMPHARFLAHPHIHVFDRPRTYVFDVRGTRVALAGFPFHRRDVRAAFTGLLESTGWRSVRADVRLLCVHHCVEGATVGPGNYTFTTADDVIRARDLPPEFAAMLSGHIHRHQVLTTDLRGRPLPAPVLYPGSIERTATAEIGEEKGWLMLQLVPGAAPTWHFRRLPARPMLVRRIDTGDPAGLQLDAALHAAIVEAPADAVLVIRVEGEVTEEHARLLAPARIRSIAPPTMNVEVRASAFVQPRRARTPAPPRHGTAGENLQLDL